ncbi:MAG: hypothetical protein EBV03_02185 [Proteobacteria bacterium]|nr:hypothetical protein [Pseudomonadota bacterium]
MAEETYLLFHQRMDNLRAFLGEKGKQAAAKIKPRANPADVENWAAEILLDHRGEHKQYQKMAHVAAVLATAACESDCEVSGFDGTANFPKLPQRTGALVSVLKNGMDRKLAAYCSANNYPAYTDRDEDPLYSQIIAFGNQLRQEMGITLPRGREGRQ